MPAARCGRRKRGIMDAVVARGLCKSFGSVKANNDISLTVRKGEILALLGENGSGKSTLVNMLAGIYAPDRGSIYIDGKRRYFASPEEAIAAGVGMVHQHFKLVEVMTGLENVTLGERQGGFWLRRARISAKIDAIEKQFGCMVDMNRRVYSMAVSEKQTVEILKILYRGARILILDEPTAVLTPQETDRLFEILRVMKNDGCSIIIITHKLGEVMRISDRVTVLRKGRCVGTVNTAETSEQQLAELMVGSAVELDIERVRAQRSERPLLEVKGLCCRGADGRRRLKDVSFDLYGGEILGVAGIVGAGQKELCETITGMQKTEAGSVLFCSEELLPLSPLQIKRRGIRSNFIPEDRLGMGLAPSMDIADNLILRSYDKCGGFFVDRSYAAENARETVERYAISTPSIHSIVRKLSGGNIQKVLLGREIGMEPKLLIASYPFRGLDVGAVNTIIAMLNEEKKKGVAILLMEEDIDQLLALGDRLMVLHDGSVMDIVDSASTTKDEIGMMMMGAGHKMAAASGGSQ